MEVNLSTYPKLTKEQVGHLRHFYNLASQLDGEWLHMGTQEPMQEFLDAYRYQLATMVYAIAAAHLHRQDALYGVYKPLMRRLIQKMLRREVWGYWFTTSLGGTTTDPSLTQLRTPWADPIVRENIMYSGHLLLMTSLYAMLFDDDEFERDDSMMFHWNPLFYGLGPETFSYKNQTLQEAILREMERNGWLGIIAMRLNDVRHSTNVVEGVLTKYKAAWAKKGMSGPDGLFKDMWLAKQDYTLPAERSGFLGLVMRVDEFVELGSFGYITTIDGESKLHPPVVGNAYRKLVAESDGGSNEPKEVLQKALEIAKETSRLEMAAKTADKPLKLYAKPTFGYVSQWLSELGKSELNDLLKFADENLNPTWENGGLYYPRNDKAMDEKLQWTHMDPFSGNAAIGYARLNIEDGTKKLWERPWTQEEVRARPSMYNVTLADGIDFLRGLWDGDKRALLVTMRSWEGSTKKVTPIFKNLSPGKWEVMVNKQSKTKEEVEEGGEITIEIEIGGADVDVVVVKRVS